ncbi:hypothetical protein V8F20_012781 [Naviculisporaceae sp. PSN 640]
MTTLLTTSIPTITAAPSLPDWTNLGPLTTIFTPPASCFSNGNFDNSKNDSRPFAYIPDRWPSLVFINTNDVYCYPPTTSATRTLHAPITESLVDFQHSYYSPGLCPSGWYIAADYGPKYAGSPRLVTEEGEHIAACCPSGYTAHFESLTTPDARISTGSCLSVLTAPVAAVTCAQCTDITRVGVTVETTAVATDPAWVLGEPSLPPSTVIVTARETTILVRWRATDEVLLAWARGAGRAHGMTTGQKVGIGLGVGIGFTLLVGLGAGMLTLITRRKIRKQAADRKVLDENVAYKLGGDSEDD